MAEWRVEGAGSSWLKLDWRFEAADCPKPELAELLIFLSAEARTSTTQRASRDILLTHLIRTAETLST